MSWVTDTQVLVTLRSGFRLCRGRRRSQRWCRIQCWCRGRSWRRKRCQHRCWHRRLKAHTASKRVRTFVIARAGVKGELFTANCLRLMTFSAPHLPLALTGAAAARIHKIVNARVPPLTGATDARHVWVNAPLFTLELTDALCAGRKIHLRVPRFRVIVIARVPPFTGATVPRHVMVNRGKPRVPWIRMRVPSHIIHLHVWFREKTVAAYVNNS